MSLKKLDRLDWSLAIHVGPARTLTRTASTPGAMSSTFILTDTARLYSTTAATQRRLCAQVLARKHMVEGMGGMRGGVGMGGPASRSMPPSHATCMQTAGMLLNHSSARLGAARTCSASVAAYAASMAQQSLKRRST